ncbi:polysaccharide pyruvyl transferase [Algoriphagus ratkowskyi]|uniref:Polysaccharide pyruvyl transferase n=1 Tax=Algoriphagus ratkowskyi TaxID=57028 RepID=A0A2W7RYT3_9BACT|nr:polysaccharide pyruvyl transferase family protein [Algoriphagus ratkowskyi]PZX59759.1 polysaccharide pyruvyl transferase [Algoriphagus ratkowskyi]TXD78529.1 polysaccharide pyruvyl transferase family protein [Algoriphagus ratkowskyi]
MTKVLIIGAFDRYNYGDLLFPLVIERQLSTYGENFHFEYFGLIESDLSSVGGLPTKGLKKFYKACSDPSDPVNVIIAGGEALGVTWNSLYAALNPLFQRINKRHVKVNKVLNLNAWTKKILKGKTTLPFVFDKSDFAGVQSVTLNSLGGSGLGEAIFEKYDFLKEKLQNADYFAVRDQLTVDNLLENGVKADLFPDSAILMSEFYPMDFLRARVTKEVAGYVDENAGKYVFAQINKKTTRGHEQVIARGLDEIYLKEKIDICLCPIGKALDHDDHEALQELGHLMSSPHTYFDADNIWDIMYLLANAKCYVGTSLHGAITAMSFAVPHVGLKVEKLGAYLATWGVKENQHSVEFSELYEHYKIAVSITKMEYEASRDRQLVEIKKGFGKMMQVLKAK